MYIYIYIFKYFQVPGMRRSQKKTMSLKDKKKKSKTIYVMLLRCSKSWKGVMVYGDVEPPRAII